MTKRRRIYTNICQSCGVSFHPWYRDQRFCSSRCGAMIRAAQQRRHRPGKTCESCSKRFEVTKGRQHAARFCSHRCYWNSLKDVRSDEERFWSRVGKGPSCWEWTAGKFPYGYGSIKIGSSDRGAHRYSYELHFGRIPEGMMVCHHCDNPGCVRPDHLFLGSATENARDMVAKRRHVRMLGERHGGSKLTAENVIWARRRRRAGATYKELADVLGMSKGGIRSAVIGKSWGWLNE